MWHRNIFHTYSFGQGTALPSEPESGAGAAYGSGVEYFPAMHKALASIPRTSQTNQAKHENARKNPFPGLYQFSSLSVSCLSAPPMPDGLSSPVTLFLVLHRVNRLDIYSPHPAVLRANYLHQSAASAEGQVIKAHRIATISLGASFGLQNCSEVQVLRKGKEMDQEVVTKTQESIHHTHSQHVRGKKETQPYM